ncbi:hypothetical protein HJC23_000154, partial [Cyclotella cryptica]
GSLDFNNSVDTPTSFLLKSVFMLVVWVSLLSLTRRSCQAIATIFWSQPIPINSASIPSKLPHPNAPGSAIPFDIPLLKASERDIENFMLFMRKINLYTGDNRWLLQDVANSAAAYKGRLYEERAMKWVDDHFRLKLPNLKYPYVDRHWNGWSSFWRETGPHIHVTVIVEHLINGLCFPLSFLITQNDLYYNLALYGEVAYMCYATALIGSSYYLGRDITIEQMHPAVWPLLILHHISSMILCIGCIFVGDGAPRNLVCCVLLSLLGLTSSLHYVGQIFDFSPISQANTPYTRFMNHILCLASQVIFRGFYWMKICYSSVRHCVEVHGAGLAIALLLILMLFTAFNVDFVKFHYKATKGCWLKIQAMKKQ